jgi:hypothetical protein
MQQNKPGDFLSLVSDLIPFYVHRYQWSESDHPRHTAGRPEGGQFRSSEQPGGQSGSSTSIQAQQVRPPGQQSPFPQASGRPSPGGQFRSTRRREVAALPDTVQRGHALHLSVLDQNTKSTLQSLGKELASHLARVDQAQTEQDKEYAWSQVDKNAVRATLARINDLDHKHGEQNGARISDFVNANGMIPRFLAERLDSGSRFFDPEKIRDKLGSQNRGTPAFSDDEESAFRQFQSATRFDRKRMLENPDFRSVVERKMGLTPSRQSQSADSVSQPADSVSPMSDGQSKSQENAQDNTGGTVSPSSQEQQPAPAEPPRPPAPKPEFSPQLRARMMKAIHDQIGDDNYEAQVALEQMVPEAFKTMVSEAQEWNEGIRGIHGLMKAKGQSLGSFVQQTKRAQDGDSIKGFDEYVDLALRHYPHLTMGKWGPEEALLDAFRTGLKQEPKIDSPEVMDRAIDMLGPGFRQSLENHWAEAESSFDDSRSSSDEFDPVPFSVRAWMNWISNPRYSLS